ncbi:MAG: ABC transporter permease [Thermoanaerobaculia bacterium]
MTALDGVREALLGVMRYPMRSALALLGLVVGVSSIVASLALLVGVHRFALQSAIQRSRLDVLTLESPPEVMRNGRPLVLPKPVRFTQDDVDRVKASVPGVRDAMAVSEDTVPVRREGTAFDVQVFGVGANAGRFLPMEIEAGRFFGLEEAHDAARVAVLTHALAEDLFGKSAEAVAKELLIGGQRFDVVGIVTVPREGFSGDERRACYVPFRAKEERLSTAQSGSIVVAAVSLERVPEVREGLERLVPRLRPGIGKDGFAIQTSEDDIHAVAVETAIRGATLGGVALMALLVAAGGILNTFLVGVKERTREIGTRRALGATRLAIRSQFLLEALVLSIPGGVLGIAVGGRLSESLAKRFASGLMDPSALHVHVGVPEALVGLTAAVLVSVGAGLVPAWRSANVDPTEALRYE